MKYFALFLLALAGCSNQDPDPIFYKDQEVTYIPHIFYKLVCSGNGTISEYYPDSDGKNEYKIKAPVTEKDCPTDQFILEKNIKAKK